MVLFNARLIGLYALDFLKRFQPPKPVVEAQVHTQQANAAPKKKVRQNNQRRKK